MKSELTQDDSSRQPAHEIRQITWAGMVINVLLSVLKFIVGTIGSSQAVVADAVHSLSDLTTDVAILFGVRYWATPPDDEHPYGHWRIETMVTLSIAIVLALVAVGIGYRALTTIRDEHIEPPGVIALIGSLSAIVAKEILYRWTVAVGKRVKSSALLANAWHHRSDVLSSIPVVIVVIVAKFSPRYVFVDHVGALIVSLFILRVSWGIVKAPLAELADAGVSSDVRVQIRALVLSSDDVISIHGIRTRKVGSGIHVDLHIMVDGNKSVRRGHDISEAVKQRLLDKGPHVVDVIVHLEPYGKGGDEE